MKEVVIYTDGACSGNPGPGGYCAILIYGKKEKIVSGGEALTTNNQMELLATIKGLSSLKEKCSVKLYTDSAYVSNAFLQDWITSWQLNNWKTSNKKPVANKELWQQLIDLCSYHKVKWIKVKGHSDNKYNNKCDEIARAEILKLDKNNIDG